MRREKEQSGLVVQRRFGVECDKLGYDKEGEGQSERLCIGGRGL